MALIYNASEKAQVVTVYGNTFTLKENQIKTFQDNIAHFLCTDRKDMGFVSLPEEFDDPSFKESPEGKAILAAKKIEGVTNRVRRLKETIYNLQVSLKMDLEKANIKVDPRILATDGEIAAMEELLMYQRQDEDSQQKKIDKLKEMETQLGKVTK